MARTEMRRSNVNSGGRDSRAHDDNGEMRAPDEKEGEHWLDSSTRSINGVLG